MSVDENRGGWQTRRRWGEQFDPKEEDDNDVAQTKPHKAKWTPKKWCEKNEHDWSKWQQEVVTINIAKEVASVPRGDNVS